MTMIVSERDTHLIIRTKNDVYEHRPNDSYNRLKYGDYESERVIFRWNEESNVEETYDERIFNCYYKTERLQLRKANDICKAILTKDVELYEEVFKSQYYTLHKAELLAGFIDDNYQLRDRVVRTKDDDFIVDDVFKVDGHANTYVLETHRIKESKRERKWRNLCTVISVKNLPKTLHTKTIGDVKIDTKTLNCLTKIIGLVSPMLWDRVIWNQIPKWLQKIYRSEGILTDSMAKTIGYKNE